LTVQVFRLTMRQLLGRKSTLIPVGLALIPIIVAIVFRLSSPEGIDPERWTARTLLVPLVVTATLPLTALLLATSVLGDELEDGTFVYLVTKPVARWRILLPKIVAPALVAVVLGLVSTVVSGVIVLQGVASLELVRGFAIAVAAGGLAYTTMFALFSLATSRALITGLVYVFLWEATVTNVFKGIRYLSIRQYILGIADWFSVTPSSVFNANLGGMLAVILFVICTILAAILANDRLKKIEVREST